jgi:hypothetical protein
LKETLCGYLITEEISDLIDGGIVAFILVKIERKAVGLICIQRLIANETISKEDFQQVCSFIDHLNMCLTMTRYNQ